MKKNIFIIFIIFTVSNIFAQGPEMVLVEGGEFYMGNDYAQGGYDEKPEHKITVDGFYMSKYEVTFELFDLFCANTGYPKADDGGHGRGQKPVINVSWEGAIKFCNWLSTKYRYDKVYEFEDSDSSEMVITKINWDANGYRLPTEAEWEYVAKGGKKSKGYIYSGSNVITDVAWFLQNSKNTTHEVGQLQPNELGVYDILGNAKEWCWDYYEGSYYQNSPKENPRGPAKATKSRTYRGGDFKTKSSSIRATKRFSMPPTYKAGLIGIRLVQNKNAQQK